MSRYDLNLLSALIIDSMVTKNYRRRTDKVARAPCGRVTTVPARNQRRYHPPAVQYGIYGGVTNLEVLVSVVSQLGLTWVTEYTTKPERHAWAPVLSLVLFPR